jgi:hypothetical protein
MAVEDPHPLAVDHLDPREAVAVGSRSVLREEIRRFRPVGVRVDHQHPIV